jgi:hypothetical protein
VFFTPANFLAKPEIFINLAIFSSAPSSGNSGITDISSPWNSKPWPENVITFTA